MKRLMLLSSLLFVCFVPLAHALELEEAKRSGLVGEKRNGYLAAVKTSAEVSKLVEEINAKRRSAYAAIAAKNGTDQKVVEQVGAKEAFQKSPAGALLESSGGGWEPKR